MKLIFSANKSNQHQVQRPSLPVNAAEFKRRMGLMQRWFAEFSDAQRTAAVETLEPLLGASQLHLLASRLPNEV